MKPQDVDGLRKPGGLSPCERPALCKERAAAVSFVSVVEDVCVCLALCLFFRSCDHVLVVGFSRESCLRREGHAVAKPGPLQAVVGVAVWAIVGRNRVLVSASLLCSEKMWLLLRKPHLNKGSCHYVRGLDCQQKGRKCSRKGSTVQGSLQRTPALAKNCSKGSVFCFVLGTPLLFSSREVSPEGQSQLVKGSLNWSREASTVSREASTVSREASTVSREASTVSKEASHCFKGSLHCFKGSPTCFKESLGSRDAAVV